jgi:hypothetical protein
MEDHHAVPDAEVGDTCAGLDDRAGHFVSEDARGGVRAGVDLLEVSAADTTGVDLDKQFTGGDLGDGDGLDADVVYAVIDGGRHFRRQGGGIRHGTHFRPDFGCGRHGDGYFYSTYFFTAETRRRGGI